MLQKYLDGVWMPQEVAWAGAESIGTRLKDCDPVTDFRPGQVHVLSKHVEGCAQGAHNRGGLVGRAINTAGDAKGIIAPYHLPEISGQGEMMVQSAVGHEVGFKGVTEPLSAPVKIFRRPKGR